MIGGTMVDSIQVNLVLDLLEWLARGGSSIVGITPRGIEPLQQRRPFTRFEDGMEKAL